MGFSNRQTCNRALLILLILSCATLAHSQQALDLNGHPLNPLTTDSGKITVLIFLRRDCPVSSRYAPVIQQIGKRYAASASFWLVYPDKTDSPDAIRQHMHDYGYRLPALRDPEHALARLSHVQITPEVAVFNRQHEMIYDGRIDNWYVDLAKSRSAPTTHELEDAIKAASEGKPIAKSEVRGVGCYISDLD